MLKTYGVKYFRSSQFSIKMLKFPAFNFCRAHWLVKNQLKSAVINQAPEPPIHLPRLASIRALKILVTVICCHWNSLVKGQVGQWHRANALHSFAAHGIDYSASWLYLGGLAALVSHSSIPEAHILEGESWLMDVHTQISKRPYNIFQRSTIEIQLPSEDFCEIIGILVTKQTFITGNVPETRKTWDSQWCVS